MIFFISNPASFCGHLLSLLDIAALKINLFSSNLRQVLKLDLHLLPLVMHRPFPTHFREEEEEETKANRHPFEEKVVPIYLKQKTFAMLRELPLHTRQCPG